MYKKKKKKIVNLYLSSTFFKSMTSLQPKVSVDLHSSDNNIVSATMTRDDILTLAQNEYARQLCKYTKAQLDNTKLYKSKQPSSLR